MTPPHHGAPLAEQRAWEAGCAYAPVPGDVLRVTGPDRLTWLDSLGSAKVRDLPLGASAESLILGPDGRVEHAFGLVDDGTATWLVTAPQAGAALGEFLESMRFALRVAVEPAPDVALLALPTPTAGGDPAPVAGPLFTWTDPWPGVVAGGTRYAEEAGHPGHGWHLTLVGLPGGALATARDTLGGRGLTAAGTWALEALRIAAWRPSLAEARAGGGTPALPHELDWLRTAVHLNKGCYRGQETVSKVFTTGRPPRRLTLLHLDGSAEELPAPGTPLTVRPEPGGAAAGPTGAAAGAPVGVLTSAAVHHELGPIALGLVKRGLDPTTGLLAGPVPAAQQVVVPVEGHAADRPRFTAPPKLAGPAPGRRLGLGGGAPAAHAPGGAGGQAGAPASRPHGTPVPAGRHAIGLSRPPAGSGQASEPGVPTAPAPPTDPALPPAAPAGPER